MQGDIVVCVYTKWFKAAWFWGGFLGLSQTPYTADSSCYAEHISLHDVSHGVFFPRQLLDDLNMPLFDLTPLSCGNDTTGMCQPTEDHTKMTKSLGHSDSERLRQYLGICPLRLCEED